MFGLPFENPLTQYHNYLRIGAASGYPNQQYASPHPYEMSAWSQMRQPNRYPFRYGVGRGLRMQIKAPDQGGWGMMHGVDRSQYRPFRNNSWSYGPSTRRLYAPGLSRR